MRALPADPPATSLARLKEAFRCAAGALSCGAVAPLCNALWSWLFFRWRLGGWAFADILVLDALVAATLVAFWRILRGAGLLLVPYLAWICFATALTWAVWQGNPGVLR